MIWDEWQKYDIRALLWIMHTRIERLEDDLHTANIMIRKIKRNEDEIMSLVDDLKSDMDAMTDAVARNSDQTQSAKMAIDKLVDQVSHMASSAQDFETLRSNIRDWTAHVKSNSDTIAESVAHVPADTTSGGETDTGSGDTGSGNTGTDTTGDTTGEPQP
jgi:chromosome segregation ATPase